MNQVLFPILSFFCLGVASGFSQEVPNDMQLFLLIGQSNMAGRGTLEAQDQITNPNIFMFTKENEWVLAKDPVHFDKPEIAGVGLCSEFARTLLQDDSKLTVGLIPCAMGGTSLGAWQPGGTLFITAATRAREAMKRGRLAGILWHQGESDAGAGVVANYGERFAAMIAQLRKDLGAEDVPVIVGELGPFLSDPAAEELNVILNDLPKTVPYCAGVSSKNLTDKGDSLHFDAASLRTFGKRYAEAFIALRSEGAKP